MRRPAGRRQRKADPSAFGIHGTPSSGKLTGSPAWASAWAGRRRARDRGWARSCRGGAVGEVPKEGSGPDWAWRVRVFAARWGGCDWTGWACRSSWRHYRLRRLRRYRVPSRKHLRRAGTSQPKRSKCFPRVRPASGDARRNPSDGGSPRDGLCSLHRRRARCPNETWSNRPSESFFKAPRPVCDFSLVQSVRARSRRRFATGVITPVALTPVASPPQPPSHPPSVMPASAACRVLRSWPRRILRTA